MLDVMRDLLAKQGKSSIKKKTKCPTFLFVKRCIISEMEVHKKNAKKVFNIANFRKVQFHEKIQFLQKSCQENTFPSRILQDKGLSCGNLAG